jgi:hypothetical protein
MEDAPDGLSYGEIAKLLGITRQAVFHIEQVALQKCRLALARESPEFRLRFDAEKRPVALVEVDCDSSEPRCLRNGSLSELDAGSKLRGRKRARSASRNRP